MNEFSAQRDRRQTARESEKKLRKKRLAVSALASLFIHGGIIFHEKLGDAPKNINRLVEKLEKRTEKNKFVADLLEENNILSPSGEPIPVDLSSFHFAYEGLAGGINESKINEAKQEYERILEKAQNIKDTSNDDFREVMGYVLKQQGEYDPDDSLLSDLLIEHKGNCEAREKYISSALQDLYPELVSSGQVFAETFRPYVDKNGKANPGHIRVIIQKDPETLLVLEGDSIKEEEASQHVNIRKSEITRVTVQGALAAAGEYSFEPIKKTQNADKDLKSPGIINSFSLATDSIMSYPVSGATYAPTTNQNNIDPNPIEGSYAGSRRNPIEVELLLEPTLEQIKQSLETYRGSGWPAYPVYKWHASPELFELLETALDGYPGSIVLDQSQVPSESFIANTRGIDYQIIGVPSKEEWGENKVNSLNLLEPGETMPNIDTLPIYNRGSYPPTHITLTFSSQTKANKAKRAKKITRKFTISEIPEVDTLTFEGDDDIDIIFPPFSDMDEHKVVPNLNFNSVKVPDLKDGHFWDVIIRLSENQPLRFSGSSFKKLKISFVIVPGGEKYSGKSSKLTNDMWMSGESTTRANEVAIHSINVIDAEGFKGLAVDHLIISAQELKTKAFAGSNITKLEMTVPIDVNEDAFADADIQEVTVYHYVQNDKNPKVIESLKRLKLEFEKQQIPYQIIIKSTGR